MSGADLMTDASKTFLVTAPAPGGAASEPGAAGALLRAARQKQGLHIAALAAAIKVPPARLEALEAGRYHELLDVTFTRALAQAVCRVLRIDPVPVLALLPGSPPDALGRVDGGLNTPFRERPGRAMSADWAPWRHPLAWLAALLLLAAAAFVLIPNGVPRDSAAVTGADAPAAPLPAASAALLGVDGASPQVVTATADAAASPLAAGVLAPGAGGLPAASAGRPEASPAAAAVASAVAPGGTALGNFAPTLISANGNAADVVVLTARQSTWVQAVDGSGKILMARMVPAGETIEMTPSLPLKLRIGNVSGSDLSFRGKPVNLVTRDNIANIILQ